MAIERYNLRGTPILSAQLLTGDTVSVTVYQKTGTAVALTANVATENVASSSKYDYQLAFTSTAIPASGLNYYDIKFSGSLQTVWKSFSWNEDVSEFGDAVFVDTVSGTNTTDYPAGTAVTPTNNIDNALTIAARINVNTIKYIGDMTLTSAISGYTIEGLGTKENNTIHLNGQNTTNTTFFNVGVKGTCSGFFYGQDIVINTGTNYECRIDRGFVDGDLTIKAGSEFTIYQGYTTYNSATVDCNANATVVFADFGGTVRIDNITAFGVFVWSGNPYVTFGSTCTLGVAFVDGFGRMYDNSGPGFTVTPRIFPENTFNQTITSYTSSGTAAEMINYIKNTHAGGWEITGNQMIFYEADNSTTVATFDLLKDGAASEDEPNQRKRA